MILQGGEMRLADRIDAASLGALNLIAVRNLRRAKNRDVTRLQFVRRMRRNAAWNNVIARANLQHLKCLLRLKAIRD